MNSIETLAALKAQTGFSPLGTATGNLTLGRGMIEGRAIHVAIIENRVASGSLGVEECDKLASLLRIAAMQRTPLILFLDSAGARVSQGLPALGAFRHMYRAALQMSLAGTPLMVVAGANCYGGASMLAALAGARRYSDGGQLAMSGPSILAQAAGGSALDDMFRAIVQAAIGADARAKLNAADALVDGRFSIAPVVDWRDYHRQLALRLKPASGRPEALQRKDLTLLFPEGYELTETAGVVSGTARDAECEWQVLGVVNRQLMNATTAWTLAEHAWNLAGKKVARIDIVIDCEAHTAALDDERIMLSSYLADLAVALASLGREGVVVETTVLGTLGGGVYVALAAASAKVNVVYGGHIQLLPGKVIASILGAHADSKNEIADYVAARVAEQELRIGLVPTG